ncbi:hypothetical protein LXL04_018209 [Taraxacum kok-saghyz]
MGRCTLRFKRLTFRVVHTQTAASSSAYPPITAQHLFSLGSPNPMSTNPPRRSTQALNFRVSIGHVAGGTGVDRGEAIHYYVLEDLGEDNSDRDRRAEAIRILKSIKSFDFVFCLHMMVDILAVTNHLNIILQKKDQDIVNAMNQVNSLHHYHVDVFKAVIDMQFQELNHSFGEANTKLLLSITCLCPRESFKAFNLDKLMELATLYQEEFPTEYDLQVLEVELKNYIKDVREDERFSQLKSIGELAKKIVKENKHIIFPKVYLLLKLALILPIATASVERAFSAMKLVKTDLRNKMGDQFLSDSTRDGGKGIVTTGGVITGIVTTGRVIASLIGWRVTGGLIGGSVTGGLIGGSVTGGLIGGSVTGALIGGRVTGGLIGGRVTGGLIGGSVTGGLTIGGLTTGGFVVGGFGWSPQLPHSRTGFAEEIKNSEIKKREISFLEDSIFGGCK